MMNGSSSGISSAKHGDQPDSDAIKMFIGQIPKTWGEAEVRELLEVYGPIYQLNILREKGSVISKGCCFVTFYTRKAALDAQNALHNIKALPGVHHCVQMKPADSENKSEDRKLFVGMLSKKLTEQDLRIMFSPFGTIEECRILLNPDGISKGCAFITYSKRASAQAAIRHMHQSMTLEGCSAPIVVKIADSPKDKEWKKTQLQLAQQLNQLATQWKSFTGLAALAPILQSLSNCNSNAVGLGNTNGGNQSVGGLSPSAVQQALNIAAAAQTLLNNSPAAALPNVTSNTVQPSNHISSNMTSSPVPYPSGAVANGFGSPCVSSANSLEHMSQLTLNSHCGVNRGVELGHLASSSSGTSLRPTANMLVNMAALTQPSSLYNHSMLSHLGNSVAGSQKEGPEGANLFIYHLPSHFTDHDLLQAFIPFGNVISAKVFIDKQTNLSKCFGFVSYDNPLSAQQAIQAMHGFQIGVKRLKVQLKRSKNEVKTTY